MDDVETFVIIGNFEEIPVIVVSRSDLSAENGPLLGGQRVTQQNIVTVSPLGQKQAGAAKTRSPTVNPRK